MKRHDARTFLVYVRQSYHRAADAGVIPETQEGGRLYA